MSKNNTENLINYLEKMGNSGLVKECAYSIGEQIFINIVHENGRFECEQHYCDERIKSIYEFLTKMFVV